MSDENRLFDPQTGAYHSYASAVELEQPSQKISFAQTIKTYFSLEEDVIELLDDLDEDGIFEAKKDRKELYQLLKEKYG